MGQILISTACAAFENFLSDAVKFKDMDECLTYIHYIISEESSRELLDNKYVDSNKSIEDVYYRLKRKFSNEDDCIKWIIIKTLSNLSQENLNRIYFKNNLYEFLDNSKITRDRLRNIIVNSKNFLDPMKPEKDIANILNKFNKSLLEYVHYNHPISNKQLRVETETRYVVRVLDTDSKILEPIVVI